MLTKKEKQARIEDIKNVLIPELIPDQLQLLGITDFNGNGDEFTRARTDSAQGIEFIQLLIKRAEKVRQEGGLYKDRENKTQSSQLSYVRKALSLFMQEAMVLNSQYPTEELANNGLYEIVDSLVFLALSAGYFSGHNDALAITDRYINFGYKEKVINPHSGGKAKSSKYQPFITLTNHIASHIYQNEKLGKISKPLLAEAIYRLISDFSEKNKNNKKFNIFKDRCPEISTIERWLRPIKNKKNKTTQLKPTLKELVKLLAKEFPEKELEKFLK